MSVAHRAAEIDPPAPSALSDRPSPNLPAPLAEAGERGVTTLADKVVEKIASRAALDVAHAAGLSRRLAGRSIGSPRVRTHADIDGHVTSLRLDLALEYPAPARQVTRAVREHVSQRVSELCDLRVDHIDITVAVLQRPEADRRRVQ